MFFVYLVYLATGLLAYVGCVCFYRIYLSPLSRFPGPKLAAASLLYEGYYDLVKDGQYPWRIWEMHEKYGPVVRVNPREIHIRDPDYVDTLYLQKLDKDPWFSRAFGIPLAGFGTWAHDLHRQRRGAINKFFSKASITSRVDLIEQKVSKLCEALEPYAKSKDVVQIDAGFTCLTVDIIAEFCYGVDYRYLEVPGFDRDFKAMIENIFGSGAFNRQVPAVLAIMQALPVWLAMRLTPQVAGILKIRELIRDQAKRIIASSSRLTKNDHGIDDADESDLSYEGISREPTIFHQIVRSKKLPAAEKSEDRLVQEGQSLIAAGSETTSRVLYLSLVHLLKQPHLLTELRRELQTVMPTPTSTPTLQSLERLPYLTAVIKESIRLAGSTATRTSRLSPSSNPLRYKKWVFPPGTPVSITLFDIMMDETLFPSPKHFDPLRWLTKEHMDGREAWRINMELDKYFVAFSKGPRSCVGMWLA